MCLQTPECKARVPDLKEGNVYQFRVRAVNKAGPGEPGDATEPHTAKARYREYCSHSKLFTYVWRQTNKRNSSWMYNQLLLFFVLRRRDGGDQIWMLRLFIHHLTASGVTWFKADVPPGSRRRGSSLLLFSI